MPEDPVHLFCQRLRALAAADSESSASPAVPSQTQPREFSRARVEGSDQ
jgi:hypothetical protein